VTQWLSVGGDTTLRQLGKKWGVASEDVEVFLEGLFETLVAKHLLVPVQLKGPRTSLCPTYPRSIKWMRTRSPLRWTRSVAMQQLSQTVPSTHTSPGGEIYSTSMLSRAHLLVKSESLV